VVQSLSLSYPLKVIYIDWENINWNAPQQTVLDTVNAGFNVVIIAFYLSGGNAADMALAWAGVSDSVKQQTMATVHSKGAVVLISLGGSTDTPFSKDPVTLGKAVGNWAKAQHLDGVDFDLENFAPGFVATGKSSQQTIDWVVNVTDATKSVLGAGGIISHAPQAPYFGLVGASNTWVGPLGGYSAVEKRTKNVDFYNVQFYNQGAQCYTDYNGLFISSCSVFPGTSVTEIQKSGIPLNKIVVGKPVTASSASNGWVAPATLGGWFKTAKSSLGWNTGVMGWEWSSNSVAAWIAAIF